MSELAFAPGHVPSLPALVEEMTWSPGSRTDTPICELSPMVLEPNRRRVESERELEEPTFKMLARTFR